MIDGDHQEDLPVADGRMHLRQVAESRWDARLRSQSVGDREPANEEERDQAEDRGNPQDVRSPADANDEVTDPPGLGLRRALSER